MGILEALGYGIPCIVTAGTTLKDTITDSKAGWGCENDEISISNALLKAIREKDLWNQYSINAVELVKNNFSWEIVTQSVLEMYRKIVQI